MSSSCHSGVPRRALALAGCLLFLSACAHVRVKSDYDRDLDFSQFQTFDWLEPPLKSEPADSPVEELIDPFAKNSLLDKRVRRAVEQELMARGYQRAPDGRPEFQLRYHVILKDRMKVRGYRRAHYGYRHYPYAYGGSVGGVSSYNYKEGTLILDVIDSRTQQLAWRGWVVGINREGYYTDEKVGEAVKKVLERFPPEGPKVISEEEQLRRRVRELEERLREVDDPGGGEPDPGFGEPDPGFGEPDPGFGDAAG